MQQFSLQNTFQMRITAQLMFKFNKKMFKNQKQVQSNTSQVKM